jgi:DNA-binding NtrC family response regulator
LALFAIHGKATRKRTYVSSNSVPRVFVVDDEPVIASTLAAILKLHGYSAIPFTSPLEALAAARSRPPDVLISDVMMPGLSGVDLAIQMKAQYPECKILLFSGQAATQDLLKDARNQGHSFQLLEKPVHPSAMLLMIGALMMESSLASSRTSLRPVSALPVKPTRIRRMARRTGTS